MKIGSIHFFCLKLAMLFILMSINLFAQVEVGSTPIINNIEDVKNKLQLKLLLSKEQEKQIDTLLTKLLLRPISKENREETIKSINKNVEVILTKKQKSKFDIIKSSWLDDLFDIPQ